MRKDFVKDVKALQKYVEEELNVMEVTFKSDAEAHFLMSKLLAP